MYNRLNPLLVVTLLACTTSSSLIDASDQQSVQNPALPVANKHDDRPTPLSDSAVALVEQANPATTMDLNDARSSSGDFIDKKQQQALPIGSMSHQTPLYSGQYPGEPSSGSASSSLDPIEQQGRGIDQPEQNFGAENHQILYQKPILASLSVASNSGTSGDLLKPEPRNQYEPVPYMSSMAPSSPPSQGQNQNQQQQQQQPQQINKYQSWYSNPIGGFQDQSASSVATGSTGGPPSATNIGYNQQQQQQPGSSSFVSQPVAGQLMPWNQMAGQQQNIMMDSQQSQQSSVKPGQQQLLYQASTSSGLVAPSNLNPQQQIQPGVIPVTLSGRRSSLSGWLRGITGMLANIFNRRDHPNQLALQSQANGQWVLPSNQNWLAAAQSNIQQQQQQQQQRYQMPGGNTMQISMSSQQPQTQQAAQPQPQPPQQSMPQSQSQPQLQSQPQPQGQPQPQQQQQQPQPAEQQQLGPQQSGADLVPSGTTNSYQVSGGQQQQPQSLLPSSNPWPTRSGSGQNPPPSYQGHKPSSTQLGNSYQKSQQWAATLGQSSPSGNPINGNYGGNSNGGPKNLDQSYPVQQPGPSQPQPQQQAGPNQQGPAQSSPSLQMPQPIDRNQAQSASSWSSALAPSPASSSGPASSSSWSSSPASGQPQPQPQHHQQQANHAGSSIYPSSVYHRALSLSDGQPVGGNGKLNSLIQSSTASSALPMGHYSRFSVSSSTSVTNAQSANNQSSLDRVSSSAVNEHRGFSQPLITASALATSNGPAGSLSAPLSPSGAGQSSGQTVGANSTER